VCGAKEETVVGRQYWNIEPTLRFGFGAAMGSTSAMAVMVRVCVLLLILVQGWYLVKDFSFQAVPSHSISQSPMSSWSSPSSFLWSSHNNRTSMAENSTLPDHHPSGSSSSLDSISSSSSSINGFPTKRPIPLAELVETMAETDDDCRRLHGKDSVRIEDTIFPESMTHGHSKIPRIIHITSKSRCSSIYFQKNVNRWRKKMTNHSIYFHNEAAMDRFLQQSFPEFPHLQLLLNCILTGAAKADLWRYLIVWEYGGIYTDIDAAPGFRFNATTIQPDDDAWFVPEGLGVLSQYFLSASPKHPLLYMAVLETLNRLFNVPNLVDQYVPFVTGPGALKTAMIYFMQSFPPPPGNSGSGTVESPYHRIHAGRYVGIHNRSVTVCGSKQTTSEWIRRTAVNGAKKREGFATMGQVRYHEMQRQMSPERQQQLNVSCVQHLHSRYSNSIDVDNDNKQRQSQ
jgi:hypothetical protein